MLKALRFPPHYVVLISGFPPFFLFSRNPDYVEFGDVVEAAVLILAASWAIFFVLDLVLGDRKRAALLTFFFVLGFFSFGHVANLMMSLNVRFELPAGPELFRVRYLLALYGVLGLAAAVAIVRSPRAAALQPAAAVCAWILVGLAAGQAAWPLVLRGPETADAALVPASGQERAETSPARANLPDVYLLLLDGYGGTSALEPYYGFDNRAFLTRLRALGFKVVDEARSTYRSTHLSLASVYNLRQLDGADEGGLEERHYFTAIRKNEFVRRMKGQGYRFVNISGGWAPTSDMALTDTRIECAHGGELGSALIQTSLLVIALHYEVLAARTECLIDKFATPSGQPEAPVLVMAHVLMPHPPFVFTADGSVRPLNLWSMYRDATDWGTAGYIDQVRHLNQLVLESVKRLAAPGGRAKIVVLYADHGPQVFTDAGEVDVAARRSVLLAMLAPRPMLDRFEGTSPLDAFRFIARELTCHQQEDGCL